LARRDVERRQRVLGCDPTTASVRHDERPSHYFTPERNAVGDRWRWTKTNPTRMGAMTNTSAAITWFHWVPCAPSVRIIVASPMGSVRTRAELVTISGKRKSL